MAMILSTTPATPLNFGTYSDWNAPSEWPTMSTLLAPVLASVEVMKAAIWGAEVAMDTRPPTDVNPG